MTIVLGARRLGLAAPWNRAEIYCLRKYFYILIILIEKSLSVVYMTRYQALRRFQSRLYRTKAISQRRSLTILQQLKGPINLYRSSTLSKNFTNFQYNRYHSHEADPLDLTPGLGVKRPHEACTRKHGQLLYTLLT